MGGRSRFKAGLLLLVFLSACGLKARYEGPALYKPLGAPRKTLGPHTLAVLPLEDKRGSRADLSSRWLLSWIPLVFYAGVVQDRPENPPRDIQAFWRRGAPDDPDTYARFSQGYPRRLAPSRFLQQGLVKEMEHSGLFERVAQAYSLEEAAGSDLALRGVLRSTRLTLNNISYGLIDLGLYFNFFLAAPSGTTMQELAMDLELVDPSTGKTLWEGSVSEKGTGIGSLWWYLTGFSKYSPPPLGPGPKNHGGQPLYDLLAKGMKGLVPGMESTLKGLPPGFWEERKVRKTQVPSPPAAVPEPAKEDWEPEGSRPEEPEKALERIKKELEKE